jgi:hypothetical protein
MLSSLIRLLIETVPDLLADHTAPTNNWTFLMRLVLAGSIEPPFFWLLTGVCSPFNLTPYKLTADGSVIVTEH